MKKGLVILAALALLFIIGYQNKTVLALEANKILYHSKCDVPIPYRIGTIDTRFNITKEELLADTKEAADTWGTTIGKKLFVYDPEAQLTINLTYDERQQLNTQINQLDQELKQKNQNLKPEIAEYQRKAAAYKTKLTQLNEEINKWNSQGGAPEDVYKRLIEQQEAMKKEADTLNAEARFLNQSTEAYNTQVGELQQQVGAYNETLNYKPEEGIYISDEAGQRIIVYFYTTKQELVHTLAHEMGHAVGLDHSNNSAAIMFSKTNNVTVPSADDITALTEACRKRSIVEITREKLPILMYQLQLGLNNLRTNSN